ncbi:MAG: hypothetical protein ACI9VN_000993 [Patescibacteria group bacterium]|jgi:hypothetical protein
MQFKNIIKTLTVFTILTLAFSCEDVIEVDLEVGDNQLVVDAWINNQVAPQTIRLVRTSAYFDSSQSPAETGATVFITDDAGNPPYEFIDDNNDGNYTWESVDGTSFGKIGDSYTLSITTVDNKEYTSASVMNRIMQIDSIPTEEREEDLGQPEGIYAQVYARDFIGKGDAYWIKSFKNGQFLNKPGEMNIAYDGSFSPGGNADGVFFIAPIRGNINEDDGDNAPWAVGDSIHVEIHSLTEEAYYFLVGARTQMTLGDATLFAEPPSNVPTNIIFVGPDEAEPRDVPVGFFNVAGVSEMGRRL